MKRWSNPLLLIGTAVVLAVGVVGVVASTSWVGRSFPGFLVLGNRVIASAGLARWPATAGGEIYQQEIIAVDGVPLRSAADLTSRVRELPAGTPLRYRLRSNGRVSERTIATRSFDRVDFLLLYGAFLFCGAGLAGMALGIRYLRRRDRVATGSALCLGIVGLYALTALDLYGPYLLFRFHVLLECLLFAGTLHMALVFPHPPAFVERRPWLTFLPYVASLGLAAVAESDLYHAPTYIATHRIAMGAFGVSLVALITSQVHAFVRPPSLLARQRVKVLAIGAVAALGPQVGVLVLSAATGGQASENTMGWSGIFFPIAVGYAVLGQNLLGVDSVLRRSLKYALMTLSVGLAYAAALVGFEAFFRSYGDFSRSTFLLIFSVVAAGVLLPLRDRIQAVVDRVFFRAAYDFRKLVERASARLASVTYLPVIAEEIESAVQEALHPEWLVLFVRRRSEGPLEPILQSGEDLPPDPAALRPEEPDAGEDDATLRVPFRVEDELVAVLVLGRRLSGRFYGSDDRALLLTLANQSAVAIQNARTLQELRELNESLESQVEQRTAELAGTLRELRSTQAQLIHREKMSSLGQFVAGIAHEMNNPMNFIETNLYYLKQHVDLLTELLGAYEIEVSDPALLERFRALRDEHDLKEQIRDFVSIYDGCTEGVERTVALVEDLRSFSRLDLPEYTPVDLGEEIDATLRLLAERIGAIRVEKDYAEMAPVECQARGMNQVFMNLLTNAADAIREKRAGDGAGTIRLRTGTDGERAFIEVEDDGCGIEPAVLDLVFDPFFTTKEVGKGTGLGLSIAHGIVRSQGGSILVTSEPGVGSCFRVELPPCPGERTDVDAADEWEI
jgi:signal transduction histidine kinase